MSKQYPPVASGEWVTPRRRDYRMACCDCGLVHRLNFRLVTYINGGKKIQMQAFRDNRATAQIRKHEGITITKRKANNSGKHKSR